MKITILLPVSRLYRFSDVIKQIATLERGDNEISILLISDNPLITHERFRDCIKLYNISELRSYFVETRLPPLSEMNVPARRERIALIFNLAKSYIFKDSDLVFCIEDDTIIKSDYLLKLVNLYQGLSSSNIPLGLISGVQVGRAGIRMLGLWKCDNPLDVQTLETLDWSKDNRGIEEIDASGFYCFVTSKKCFCDIKYKWGDFGPDVYFGLDLRRKGYVNFVDWDLITGHRTQAETIYPNNCKMEKIKFLRDKKDSKFRMIINKIN